MRNEFHILELAPEPSPLGGHFLDLARTGLPEAYCVGVEALRKVQIVGFASAGVIGREWGLRGEKVVELPRNEMAAAQEGRSVPPDTRLGDYAMEVRKTSSYGVPDTETATLMGEVADDFTFFFKDANEDVVTDRSYLLRELRTEIGAGQFGIFALDGSPTIHITES